METPTCAQCGIPVDPADPHTFENTKGKPIGSHCRAHCPRCAPVDQRCAQVASA